MKPEDFKNTKPELKIEKYFEGNVKAWGMLQDRKGKVTRQFSANMKGSFENNILTLEEDFFWNDNKPFISPLALPGDDIQLNNFKAFYFQGSQGLYIHPNIWHEGVFPTKGRATFKGKQGKVHARVSVDFSKEFNGYLKFKTKI